jgi:uncharacterized protein YecE (DUF72 family)
MIHTSAVVTSDFVYLRFIGDRSIGEKDFGTILKDRAEEMSGWANRLKEGQEHEHQVKAAMVAANDHYAGYGPETSNIFREMLGLERWGDEKEMSRKVDFEEVKDHRQRTMKQTSLSDFIPK